MTLKFSDGVEFDPQGELRIEIRADGLYVVGEGMVCAVETRAEGDELMKALRRRLGKKGDTQ